MNWLLYTVSPACEEVGSELGMMIVLISAIAATAAEAGFSGKTV
jgi:hypothetical protein